MQSTIKINFTDFWSDFNKKNNIFWNLLAKKYNLIISDEPDILFYSYFGNRHMDYKCLKIFFQGENVRPNFKECDYAFGFDFLPNNKRNYRLPLYLLYDNPLKLTQKKNVELIAKEKTKFCAFIVSNKYAKERIDFFKKLSQYKKVDSGGRYLNNLGRTVEDKIQFIKDYKFTIAFENSSYPGYTTEKIFEPMLVNSIPIYWGNPLVYKDFNPKSFINCHDFKNMDEVIEKIIEVDNNPELYKQILNEPYFIDNTINEFIREENIVNKLVEIVENRDNTVPVAKIYKPTPVYVKKIKTQYRMLKRKIDFLLR